jgi:hypothetical protein
MGNELDVYLFSFKLRSDGQLQVQYFSQKWHITENLERWNLGKINEAGPKFIGSADCKILFYEYLKLSWIHPLF